MIKRLIPWVLVACLALATLSGCTIPNLDEDFEDDLSQHYNLKMVMPFNTGTSLPNDLEMVLEEVNKITLREINATLTVIPYIYSEYYSKSGLMVNAAEKFDLMHTSAANYFLNVEMKALYPLETLLKKYAPETWAMFDTQIWDQMRYGEGNKIYGAINNQILPRAGELWAYNEDYFEDFMTEEGYNENSFSQMTLTQRFDVIEQYAEYLSDNNLGKGEDNKAQMYGIEMTHFIEGLASFDHLAQGAGVPGVVRSTDTLEDGKLEVINQFTSPEFLEYIDRLASWYNKGYIPEDSSRIDGATTLDLYTGPTWKPGNRKEYKQFGQTKYQKSYQFNEFYYQQAYLLGTMWSVSATSDNPGRAVRMIELLHTNAEINDLFKLGIMGTHYTLEEVTENGVTGYLAKNISNAYFNDDSRWVTGNEFLGTPLITQSLDVWEQTQRINDEAIIPDVIGFVFDRNPVLTEIQLCQNVYLTYANRMAYARELVTYTGSYDSLYDEFISAMNAVGANKVIAEKQRQLDAWLASK